MMSAQTIPVMPGNKVMPQRHHLQAAYRFSPVDWPIRPSKSGVEHFANASVVSSRPLANLAV